MHERHPNFIGLPGTAAGTPAETAAPARVLVFDACQVGVVLRAVLFVEAVVAVGAMFGAANVLDWITRLSLVTGAALPATLLWLIVACVLKKVLARLSDRPCNSGRRWLWARWPGCMAAAMLAWSGLLQPAPWLASAFAGALLAAVLVAALVLRAKGRTPAATTARLAELQSRIRPHFLFNTLNSAIALVRAEPAKAEALLEDLSDLFRHALVDQGESVTLARRNRAGRGATWPSSRCALASACSVEWALDAGCRCGPPAAAAAAAAGGKRGQARRGAQPQRRGDPHLHPAPRLAWW